MASIRDYRQDEDKPFGVGTWELDDGSEYYLDDPERASAWLEQFSRESDNIADRGSVDRQGGQLSTRDKYGNAVAGLAGVEAPNRPFNGIERPEVMRGAVAGPGGADPYESRAPDESNMSQGPAESRAPGDTGGDNQSRARGEDLQSREPERSGELAPTVDADTLELDRRLTRAQSAVSPYRAGARVDPARMAREGVEVPTKVRKEGGLAPDEYNRQAEDRTRAYLDVQDVAARHARDNEQAALLQVSELEKRRLDLDESNRTRAAEVARVEGKYQEDRQWLDDQTESFFKKAKPDPNRLFNDQNAFGLIGTAIAQFMGAYAAIVSQSPNFAAQILDKQIERAVDAQMEEYRRGRARLDSQTTRMAERGMSLKEMRAALRLQQEKAVDMMAKEAASREGSRESKQAYEALAAERQQKFVDAENKYRTEALGKTTVSSDVVQPRSGSAMLTPTERLEAQARYIKAENEVGYQLSGGEHVEKATERDAVRGEKRETRLTEYANKRREIAPAVNAVVANRKVLHDLQAKYGNDIPGIGKNDVFRLQVNPETGRVEASDIQRLADKVGVERAQDAARAQQALKGLAKAALQSAKGSQSEGDVQREFEGLMGETGSEETALTGVENMYRYSTSALDELDGAYRDVAPEQAKRRDDAALRRQLDEEDREKRLKGKAY